MPIYKCGNCGRKYLLQGSVHEQSSPQCECGKDQVWYIASSRAEKRLAKKKSVVYGMFGFLGDIETILQEDYPSVEPRPKLTYESKLNELYQIAREAGRWRMLVVVIALIIFLSMF